MIRVSRWTVAALAALFLLYAIPIAGARFIQAEPTAEEKPAAQAAPAAAPEQSPPAPSSPAASAAPGPQESMGQPSSPSAAEKEGMNRWQAQTWQIHIGLDAPSLVPQAVQYAIFDKDPVAAFTAQVRRMQSFYRRQLEKADNETGRDQVRDINMSVSWDIGFKEITGNNLWLLTRRPEAGFSFTCLSSNAPAGKKWIVTKTVRIEGKPVCWCIPVEVKVGEPIEVTLSESNTFDLRRAYDNAMGEPAAAGGKAAPAKEQSAENKLQSAIPALKDALQRALIDIRPELAEGDDEGYDLYRQMIDAMRQADSLSYVSRYEIKGKGDFALSCTYRAWLKKPNYFRVEGESPLRGKGGILIGDGNRLWIYWPEGRPFVDEDSEADKKTRLTSYMTKPAPLAAHSIGHEVAYLGIGMSMPVIDPSTFHGYTDSLQAYLDGVTSLPAEKIGDEECDHILVNIMKHQRSWEIWLSKADHLPRKMKEIVRVSYDIVITEEWSEVTINGEIPDAMFAWKPPEGWTEWRMPSIETGLLKPGTEAPDFELDAADDGAKIKLSDFRGKIVWFYVWRAG